jgi:sulfur carrier protein ThiS
MPETGTPIAALNFLRREDVDVLKRSSIRTVEELANLPDSVIDSVKLPSMRNKRTQAQHFLAAQDTNKTAAQMAARDEQLAIQGAQIAELMAELKASKERPNAEPEIAVDENGDRVPKRKTLRLPEQAA